MPRVSFRRNSNRGLPPPPPPVSSSAQAAASAGGNGESASASASGSSRALEQELARVAGAIAKVEGELDEVKSKLKAMDDTDGASFESLPSFKRERYKSPGAYYEALETKAAALQTEKAALQQKDAALQQKDAALQTEKAALQQKDAALQQKDADLVRERADLVRERADLVRTTAAGLDPTPLWDRLDQGGDEYDVMVPQTKKNTSNATSTVGWPKPSKVSNWTEFTELIKPPTPDLVTTTSFKLSSGKKFDVNWNEATVVSRVVAPYLEKVREHGLDAYLEGEITLRYEVDVQAGLKPDATWYYPGTTALFPLEAKAPKVYTVGDLGSRANDMAAQWKKENRRQSPIMQVFTYSCSMQSRYCVLTSGQFTWFIERNGGDLMISKGFQPSDTTPSLAQAWVTFVRLAIANPDSEAPSKGARVYLENLLSKKKASAKAGGETRSANAAAKKAAAAKSGGGGRGGRRGGATTHSLPLQELSCAFAPTESYGPLNHGVAHRNMIHGFDSVIKIVDANKDHVGEAALEHEATMYEELSGLWGTAIPSLVFSGPITLGRATLAVTYEGASLEHGSATDIGLGSAELKRKSLSALDALHRQGVLHGDLALRNIVVNPATKAVKLIDLGNARRSDDTALMAGEVQALSALFDDCDE